MRLCSVELQNFRNYESLDLSFPGGTHILYGANAQGKTNLLEAIYLCTCARSHRTARDEELVRQGTGSYLARVGFITDRGIPETLSIEYQRAAKGGTPRRIIRYNDLEVARLADMMGLFHAILFAPEDLQIVKDGPSERRRFLDILISRLDRSYFRHLQDFLKILAQRNRLLKSIRAGGRSDRLPELDIWDESLAESASFILVKRQEMIGRLAGYAALALTHLTSSRELLSLHYRSFPGLEEGQDQKTAESRYLDRLIRSREDDLARGSTSQGPHRDDIQISLNGADARLYASQGQQRSAVLSLKIAELMILTEVTGEKPILLLDDVMSELDASRREKLMEVIRDHQVFMTCTDPDQLGETSSLAADSACPAVWEGPVRYYRVQDGQIQAGSRNMV
mgnify:CR=1 FL=1